MKKWLELAVAFALVAACGEPPSAKPPAGLAPPQALPSAQASLAPAPPTPPSIAPSMFDLQMRSLREYVTAFNKHDAGAITALYAEDAVFVERGELVSIGKSSIETNYRALFDAFPDGRTTITRSWHKGDTVIFEYVEGGTNTGPRGAKKGSGKKVGYFGASVLHFTVDGHVKRDTTYYDELTMEVQAGWLEGALAKLEVRPVVSVPATTSTWDVHRATGAEDEQQKLVAVRQKLYSSFSMRSQRDFLAVLTDDVVIVPYDDPKNATGKSEVASLFGEWLKTFSTAVINADEAWGVDGHVVLLGTFAGKHVGQWGPLKPTSKQITSHFLDIARVTDQGKVDRVWTYANNFELLKHLGYR